jgi:hypothetical protein
MSRSETGPTLKVPLKLLPAAFGVRAAKQLGLSKQIMRLAFKSMFSQKRKSRAFAGYSPTEHDVFVATFGKSGTNWMMQIAQQIAWRGEAEFDHIHDVVPWPDGPGPVPASLSDLAVRDGSPTKLRVIKTHLETAFVPYDERATYLTVLRDPKEVLVSSYYFLGGILGLLDQLSIDDWFDLFMRPKSIAESWAVHTTSFWDWRDRPNVLVLNFGEVKSEPVSSVERVAAVMGVELNDAQRARVVERSGFEYMKAHESQFAPPRFPLSGRGEPVRMVRRGATGGSNELLNRSQQAEVDRLCQEELCRLGSDFPYASAFDIVSDPNS